MLSSDNKRDTISFKDHKNDEYENEGTSYLQTLHRNTADSLRGSQNIVTIHLKKCSLFFKRDRGNDTEILVDVLEHVKGGIRIWNKET